LLSVVGPCAPQVFDLGTERRSYGIWKWQFYGRDDQHRRWVEQSETRHPPPRCVGFAWAQPTLRAYPKRIASLSRRQHTAQRRNRRHKEIGGGGQLDELFRHRQRRPPAAGRIVRIGLIHHAHAAALRLADDRVDTRRHRAAAGTLLAANEAGVVRLALQVLELPLDRGLVADEHQTAAMPGCRFSWRDLRSERNAAAQDAVPLRRGLVHVIARVN